MPTRMRDSRTDDEIEYDLAMGVIEAGINELDRRQRVKRKPLLKDEQIERMRKRVADWHEEVRQREARRQAG